MADWGFKTCGGGGLLGWVDQTRREGCLAKKEREQDIELEGKYLHGETAMSQSSSSKEIDAPGRRLGSSTAGWATSVQWVIFSQHQRLWSISTTDCLCEECLGGARSSKAHK